MNVPRSDSSTSADPSLPPNAGHHPDVRPIRLGQLALTRSGDKGNHVNIGVVAFCQANYEFLADTLTEPVMHEFFARSGLTRVERYLLPNLGSLNFLLYNALGGGASQSLRLDSQGKLFGPAAAEIVLPVSAERWASLEVRSETIVLPSNQESNP
jgi:hypothetical protein